MDIDTPLKSLECLYGPDQRSKYFVSGPSDIHSVLSTINLHEGVPTEVRQLFETAKNLSLYSWFVYRFHQVAELTSFSAVEMALRIRYLNEYPQISEQQKKKLSLHKLMQHAKSNQWITNEGFPSLYMRAKHNAQSKKNIEKMKRHDFDKEPSMPVEEPSEEEISEALTTIDMVEAVTTNANKLRNGLAHGSSALQPNSISTLSLNAEIINQLYEQP